jgi:SAM-dependent methyltransferase
MSMHEDRVRALSFGADPDRYDRARPRYPAALVDGLVGRETRHVLDVGCGTGIVSRLFAARGLMVLGIEPDERMARFASSRGIAVECSTFEAWNDGRRTFDLVVAGQSWHWVEPLAGAAKAASVLAPGGRFAAFWNCGNHDPEVKGALDAIYARLAPGLDKDSIVLGTVDGRFGATSAALRSEGSFLDVELRSYAWERTYTTAEWLDQLPTHSDHQTLPPARLGPLLDAIADEIERRGGRLTMRYDTACVTGVRSS